MSYSFGFQQRGAGRNQLQRGLHFGERPKRVARAMHEERCGPQPGEMTGAQLSRLSRWMERIRQQQQSSQPCEIIGLRMLALQSIGWTICGLRIGNQHGCLPATIRVAAKEDATGHTLLHDIYRTPQPLSITRGKSGKRRAMRAQLAKRQVAPQHHDSHLGKRVGYCHQKFGLAIRSRAVGEHQRVAVVTSRKMKEAANRRLCRKINEGLGRVSAHR